MAGGRCPGSVLRRQQVRTQAGSCLVRGPGQVLPRQGAAAQEELSAELERRSIRIVELAGIELPARVVEEMRGVPATDLCVARHKQLELVSLRARGGGMGAWESCMRDAC